MDVPSRVKDITGLVYGKLTVLKYIGKDSNNKTTWLCECECGNTTTVRSNSLQSNHTTSCGCYQKEVVLDRFNKHREMAIGRKYGRLVIESVFEIKDGKTYYNCRCDCGALTVTLLISLSNGNTRSCGCLALETNPVFNGSNITHGLSDHSLYHVYQHMKSRCYNKNTTSFHRYGDRGLVVCDEWLSDFMNFYTWAMSNGYRDGLTIERKNNDDGYNPNNCTWATMLEQARNRSTTKISVVIAENIRSDLRTNKEIAKEYGVDPSTISRIKTGESWK